MSTTLTEQISAAQRAADAAAAKASALQDELDAKRSEAAAAAEERVRQWARAVVDDHRDTQRRVLEQVGHARLAVEEAIVSDPLAVPRLWSQWADVAGEVVAEHVDYQTAQGILDPGATDVTPAAPAVALPEYADLLNAVMGREREERMAEAADRRQAALTAAMAVEGLS